MRRIDWTWIAVHLALVSGCGAVATVPVNITGGDASVADVPRFDVPGFDLGNLGVDVGNPPGVDVPVMSCGMPTGPAGVMNGCYTEIDCSPVCPTGHVANSATSPNFRITALSITAPATLASSIVNNAINGFLASRAFLWGLSFNTSANTLRTGSFNAMVTTPGASTLGHLADVYSYFAGNAPTTGGAAANRWNPASGTITDVMNVIATPTALTNVVRLPIITPGTGGGMATIAAELPLNNAIFHGVQLGSGNGCIGVARTDSTTGFFFNECSGSGWYTSDPSTMTPYGVLEADISVTDAEGITVTAFPGAPDLCSILSGEYSLMATCAGVPQASWPSQPTTMVGTTPAFHLVADFAAIAANVAD